MKPVLSTLLLLLTCSLIFAQEPVDSCHVENAKAKKYYDKGRDYLKDKNIPDAMDQFEKAVEEEPLYLPAYTKMAEVYHYQENDDKALENYKKVAEICWSENAEVIWKVAELSLGKGDFATAAEYYSKYLDHPLKKQDRAQDAENKMNGAKFLDKMYKNPVPYDPKPLPNVSTNKDEYLPMISPDNDFFYFTRRYDKQAKGDMFSHQVEEFTMSTREGDHFTSGAALPEPFNLAYNQGGATVTIDNEEMYLTVCNGPGVVGECDIYYSLYQDGFWRDITNLGDSINTKLWESQASISSDGLTLYFSSDREGGQGGQDIWKVVREAKGKEWSKPINLGPTINTPLDEKSPFIHPDNNTLYFSSQGHDNMNFGSDTTFDIFYSRLTDKGEWGKAQNIGYPINTQADELGLFVSTDGETAYFSSNKLTGGKGGWDIYYFPLYEGARPKKVLFMKGELRDDGGAVVQGATFQLRDMVTNKVTDVQVDSNTGKYVFAKTIDNDMMLSIQKQGFFYNSQYISKNDSLYKEPTKIDFKLDQLKLGGSYVAKNILFPTNSFELTDVARDELDNLYNFLIINPKVKIDIYGHTDNVGDPKSNLTLSQNRARVVSEWLMNKGIDKSRLVSYKGFGETKPIASNDTEPGRQQNRRTEIVIQGM